jgi:conjugal transfer/type IV secretion protein DotA/TraY
VNEIPKMSGTLMPSRQSTDRDNRFVAKALLMATAQEYLIQRDHLPLSSTWAWRGGVNSGDWMLTQHLASTTAGTTVAGVSAKQFIAGLGTIEVSCSNQMKSSTGANQGTLGGGWISSLGNMVTNAANWTANAVAQSGLPGSQLAASVVRPAQNNPVCLSEKNAVAGAMNEIYPIAIQIVSQNAQTNTGPVLPSQIAAAVKMYQTQQATAYNQMNHNKQAALIAQTQAFANQASGLGWASSAFYYWTLNNINAASQAYLKMLQPKIMMPNMSYVEQNSGNFVEPAMLAADAAINHYESSGNYISGAEAVATTGMPAGGALSSGSGVSWMGGKVMNVVTSLDAGNPLANMMADGHDIILAGGIVAAGPSATIAIAKGVGYAGGFAAGMFVPGADVTGTSEVAGAAATGGALAYGAGKVMGAGARAVSAMSGASEFAVPIGLFLVVEGAIIAYVIPAIPGVIMIFAVIGWLFVVMELMVAAPLWAAAHAYAEGEGFAPQQAMYGYSAATGIVMRPVLLTFGFIIMFFLIFIVGHFVGAAMTIYMMGMNGFHLGIVGSVAVLAIIIGTIFGSIKIVMKLITHLADTVPQYIGARTGGGFNEGVEGERAATGGATKAKVLATAAYGVGAVNKQRKAEAAMNRTGAGSSAAKPESTTNPGTNAANLGQADTNGKGGKPGAAASNGTPAKTATNPGSNGGGSPSSGGEAGGKAQPGGQSGGKMPKTSIGTGYAHGRAVRNWIASGGTPGKK